MRLEEHPFMQSISDERRAAIAGGVELIDLNDGDVIFEESSIPDALYLILSGEVTFTKKRRDGTMRNISLSGEVGVFTRELRALSAVAVGTCEIARIPESTVRQMIDDGSPAKKS